MSALDLSLAVLAVLMTPGPSNSLVLVAGAERGLPGAMRLIPAELAGYLVTVLPLSLFGSVLLADHPLLRTTVTLAAAFWVAALALRLWRLPKDLTTKASVTAMTLFVTTALNPKALIFGLVLLPSPDRLAANLGLFAGLVMLVAVAWAALGAAIRGGTVGQPRALILMRRLASVWLAAFSVVLTLRGIAA